MGSPMTPTPRNLMYTQLSLPALLYTAIRAGAREAAKDHTGDQASAAGMVAA